jgi:cytochrome P450
MRLVSSDAIGCPIVFPAERDDPFSPPSAYRDGRPDGKPQKVTLTYGGEAWLITRYHDIKALLSDDALLSADGTREGFPAVPLSYRDPRPGVFVNMDAPHHSRLRRFLAREFSAAAVEARRPIVQDQVDRLLAAFMARGPGGDLVEGFADVLPRHVSANLFGVRGDDAGFVEQCARARATHDGSAARRHASGQKMRRVLGDLVASKLDEPTDDLLGRLVSGAVRSGVLDVEELVGMATLLLAASLEATSCLISLTTFALLRDSGQGALVRADPARWTRPAVDEALRYWTIIQHGPIRMAKVDITLEETHIRAGDSVILHLHSGNWDSTVFPEPEVFDIQRDAQPHLSFGHGVHRCLGAGLGQLEAQTAVEAIFTRMPDLQLSGSIEDVAFRETSDLLYGLRSLSVIW